MAYEISYNPAAAHKILKKSHLRELKPKILEARDDVLQDVELLNSGSKVPKSKQPLDAGFIDLPRLLLEELSEEGQSSLLGRMQEAAEFLQKKTDQVVSLGIGGSYMGAKALFEALCHPFHNELDRSARNSIPRIYFEGNNLDNDVARSLLDLLANRCKKKSDVRQRWSLLAISKSGGTLETAVAFRVFRQALEKFYGKRSQESRDFVIPITGETGKLRDFSNARKYSRVFPIPDGVGGRFSIFTAVGLLPAAVLGLDLKQLLQGAADMTERFRTQKYGNNPVLDFVATSHLLEREQGLTTRILSTWGKKLESVGLWYDQLLAESIGKQETGATPITVVNTRDLHSRGQQHQEGVRDKFITNLIVDAPGTKPLSLPKDNSDQDQLNQYAGRTWPEMLDAALHGTNKAYADVRRPTADIHLPKLNEYTLGQLLQMLMLTTVLEGRLIGTNPYGQPGVEAYKNNTMANLKRMCK